jgi:hypothetical protein
LSGLEQGTVFLSGLHRVFAPPCIHIQLFSTSFDASHPSPPSTIRPKTILFPVFGTPPTSLPFPFHLLLREPPRNLVEMLSDGVVIGGLSFL